MNQILYKRVILAIKGFVRNLSGQGLSRSEHEVSGSVPVLLRSRHNPPRSLRGVKKPNFVYSRVDFVVLGERGFNRINRISIQ